MNRFVSKKFRYTTFSLLYFAQGSIIGYFTALNAIYLRSFGLSMSEIGIFSAIALLPLVLKIFLGILSDKVNFFGMGYRKPYIITGLLIQASGQLVFPLINPSESLILLTAVAFLSLTGMAMYDTCTDGFAIDTTPPDDEGKVQGIMVAGRALGIIIISAMVGILSDLTNWYAVFISLAVMTLLPIPMVLLLREPPRLPGRSFSWKAFRAFGKKPIIALGFVGIIGFITTSGTNQLVNPFLQETFGISFMMAGFYSACWGIGVVLGGLTGGRLTDRIGHPLAIKGAIITSIITVFFMAWTLNPILAWPMIFLFGLAYGYFETVYFATSMGKTDMRIAASMFAILMAIANIGSGIGLAAGGLLSDQVGYQWTFIIFAMVNLLAFLFLRRVFRKHTSSE